MWCSVTGTRKSNNPNKTAMEKILELLRELAESGEAKIEVSFKLVREERKAELKPSRPYDTDKRLDRYRRMAEFLGTCVGFVRKRAELGDIRTYTIGRKVYAYEDELLEDLATSQEHSSTVQNIFKGKGYEIQTVKRIVANA